MISVTIRNLTKRFGTTVALNKVNLQIEPGEIFFLLGPSGCGKTTLLRNIAGFYQPDNGKVLFDDEDVTRLPPHKRNTGMMFQSYALWPHMTVAKNVAFGLEERKIPKAETAERVTKALASVRMEHYADRKINQLSGGQQQRVALARALVIRPRCLLLDEPLSNLDAKLRLEMRGEIRRVCKEFGLTAIYVTHDQKEALSISDRMAIMDNGRVAQVGTPRDVYRHPASHVVADFIGETNFLPAEIISSTGRTARIRTPHGEFDGTISSPDWSPSPGDRATLSVRPEAWTLSTTDSSSVTTNAVAGTIRDSTYLGELAQYHLALAVDDAHIKVYEINPRFVELSPGDRLFARVAPEGAIILRD